MSLSELCANMVTEDEDSSQLYEKDAIEFITAPWGLGLGCTPEVPPLYPSQRFIIKMYYGLKLDDSENRDIIINDRMNKKELYRFNEKEYLEYLQMQSRVNNIAEGDGRQYMHLVIGRRSGKCVTGDSLVLTDKGIHRIEDLGEAPEDGFSDCDIGVAQDGTKKSRAKAFYNGGVKDTFRVKTKSGYLVKGTGNHRIRVMSDSGQIVWRYLDEIKPGEQVVLNRNTDLWASELLDLRSYHNSDGKKEVTLPDLLDEKLGNLLGYLVGDGSWKPY